MFVQKTAWKTWKKCPKLYEYLFVQHQPPSDDVELQFGRLFHDFASTFFDRISDEELLKCRTLADTVRLFEQFTVEQPVVKQWVQNFEAFEAARWMQCLARFKDPVKFWRPIATELEMTVEKTGQLLHVDRIGYYDETSLINIEYKSGKTFDIRDLREELTFYNLGINASGKFRLPCLWIGAYNPQLNVVFLERVSQRSTTVTYRSIQQFRCAIQQGVYNYKPSFYCRWCPRLHLCLEEGVFNEKDSSE